MLKHNKDLGETEIINSQNSNYFRYILPFVKRNKFKIFLSVISIALTKISFQFFYSIVTDSTFNIPQPFQSLKINISLDLPFLLFFGPLIFGYFSKFLKKKVDENILGFFSERVNKKFLNLTFQDKNIRRVDYLLLDQFDIRKISTSFWTSNIISFATSFSFLVFAWFKRKDISEVIYVIFKSGKLPLFILLLSLKILSSLVFSKINAKLLLKKNVLLRKELYYKENILSKGNLVEKIGLTENFSDNLDSVKLPLKQVNSRLSRLYSLSLFISLFLWIFILIIPTSSFYLDENFNNFVFSLLNRYCVYIQEWVQEFANQNPQFLLHSQINNLLSLLSLMNSWSVVPNVVFLFVKGFLVVINLYFSGIFFLLNSFELFSGSIAELFSLQYYLRNINKFLSLPEKNDNLSGHLLSEEEIKSIEFLNVDFKYSSNSNHLVIDNYSRIFDNSQVNLLPGANNGSGKSTLINLVLGVIVPLKGSILIRLANGKVFDLNHDVNLRDWRENVTLFLSYENLLKDNDNSSGQSQLISIKEQIEKKSSAQIFLLDEAYNYLDKENKETFLQTIRSLVDNKKIVLNVDHSKD